MTLLRNGTYLQGKTQNFVTNTTASQYSNVVGNITGIIRVAVNQDTWVAVANAAFTSGNVSANVVASTANSMLIPAGGVEFFAVFESTSQVGFIANSANGNISITELA